jgi:hypothetical protein
MQPALSRTGRQIATPVEEWIVIRALLPSALIALIAVPILRRIGMRVLLLTATPVLLWAAETQDLIGTIDLIGMPELTGTRQTAPLEIRAVIPVTPDLIPTHRQPPSLRGQTQGLISRCRRPR